jgi:hypothetical protein
MRNHKYSIYNVLGGDVKEAEEEGEGAGPWSKTNQKLTGLQSAAHRTNLVHLAILPFCSWHSCILHIIYIYNVRAIRFSGVVGQHFSMAK